MRRITAITVCLLCSLVLLWGWERGTSHQYFTLDKNDIAVDALNPSRVTTTFEGKLDHLNGLVIRFPSGTYKRRAMELTLHDEGGKSLGPLKLDEKSQRRTKRIYTIEPPIQYCGGRTLTIQIDFKDGPAIPQGETLQNLAIMASYEANYSYALNNFRLFKPFPFPVLSAAALLLIYLILVIFLLGNLGFGGSKDDPDPEYQRPSST